MVDIKNCDRIVVESNEKMERIIQWYKSNRDWLNEEEFRSPIPSAVIEFRGEQISLAYESEGQFVRFYLYMQNVYVCNFKYNPQTREVHAAVTRPGLKENKRRAVETLLRVDNTLLKCSLKFHSLMCFAAHFRNYVEVSGQREKSVTKKQQKQIKRSGGTIPLISTYRIDNRPMPDDAPPKGKRQYTKPTEQVGVKGFWRTLKSGKRIWVRPFTKYNDNSGKKNKTYKL